MQVLGAVSIARAAQIGAAVLFAVAGVFVALLALYLLLIAIAALFYSGYRSRNHSNPRPRSRLAVLVPAHNEADFIARCVRSLHAQTYPSELYEVIVIADNCTDGTAAIARSAGAHVLVRNEPHARGKGRALRWAIDRVIARQAPPDGIVIVDADSSADPDFLTVLVRPFEDGAQAVQGEFLMSESSSPGGALQAVAFLLMNRVRPAGRSVLGLPCSLTGSGMLFSRRLLEEKPWDAFTGAEDLEYSIALRSAGVRCVFAGGAVLHQPPAPNAEAAFEQQLRWEGGKLHVARAQVPTLVARAVRERSPALLDAAVGLATPPLSLLAAAATGGTAVGAALTWGGVLPAWAWIPWIVAVVSIPLFVLIGLRAGRAPASAYLAIVRAPRFVVTKTLRSYRLLGVRPDTWVRTQRPSDRREDFPGPSAAERIGSVEGHNRQ